MDYQDKMIKNHHLVCASMVTHLFNSYIPKLDLDLTKSNTLSLEIKYNVLDALSTHRGRL